MIITLGSLEITLIAGNCLKAFKSYINYTELMRLSLKRTDILANGK